MAATLVRSLSASLTSTAAPSLRVGLLGLGRIGQAVADLAPSLGMTCVSALVRDVHTHADAAVAIETDGIRVIDGGIDVLVEVLGGVEPARTLVTYALERGIPVVTANKSLMAAWGVELRALAAERGVPLLYDAAVLAGVPFVGALARRPVLASATAITGILNGTSHFITTAIERGASFGEALADAKARGYAEPDSRADTSGRDAAEKLTILLHLCGVDDVRVDGLCRSGIETLTPDDFVAARACGGSIKPIACASLEPGATGSWVGPAFVGGDHAFARFTSVTNALELRNATGDPILFAGPGAGPAITAATLCDDVVEASRGARSQVRGVGARGDVSGARWDAPPASRWFLRIAGGALEEAHLAELLAARSLAAMRIERGAGGLAVLTVPASWAAVQCVARTLESLGATVTTLPVVDVPAVTR